MKNTLQIVDFIKQFSGVKSERQVAKLLGMEPPALHNHKKRGTVPYKKLLTYCEDNGLDIGLVLASSDAYEDDVKGQPLQWEAFSKEDLTGVINNLEETERMFLKDLLTAQARIIELQDENALLKEKLLKKQIPLLQQKKA